MHERFVIDAEFSDILTNAQETIFDFIHAFCYGGLDGKYTQSSLSYNILGTRHHIRKVDLTYVSSIYGLNYMSSVCSIRNREISNFVAVNFWFKFSLTKVKVTIKCSLVVKFYA